MIRKQPVEIGTGIHTGQLILGTIGHDKRLETTVISDAVNTAARVEGLTKYYGAQAIVTQETLDKLGKHSVFGYRFLDQVRVKGKSNSLAIYEFLQKEDNKLTYLDRYNEGIELMRKENIGEAFQLFADLNLKYPRDKAISIFLKRCENHLENGTSSWVNVEQEFTQ